MDVKTKISVTLSEALLLEVDTLAIAPYTRSAIIEEAVQQYLANKARRERDERELNILNAHADEFNAEMADILSYQVQDDPQ
jgi:metal-responsive CopG/Arc/MetJ family transcriptional regulator